jgi:hypothetical protein
MISISTVVLYLYRDGSILLRPIVPHRTGPDCLMSYYTHLYNNNIAAACPKSLTGARTHRGSLHALNFLQKLPHSAEFYIAVLTIHRSTKIIEDAVYLILFDART